MRRRALSLSLVAIGVVMALFGTWAVAVAEESTSTTTTVADQSTDTTEGQDTTTSTSSTSSTTSTTQIPVVAVPSPVEDSVPTFLAVTEGRLAWTGMVPGKYSTMYLYDPATTVNIEIPSGLPGHYHNPSADGPWVVYQGGRAGGYDNIYLYDAGNGLVTRLTKDSGPNDGNDWNPRVDSGRVVWEKQTTTGGTGAGIYFYDLRTVSAPPSTPLLAGNDYHNPDIWGDYVVCTKEGTSGKGSEIILYDLRTGVAKSISSTGKNNENPHIDAGRVVWSSGDIPDPAWYPLYPWSTYQIELYDIATGTTKALTTNAAGNFRPAIHGSTIVWEQREPSGIVVYDYETEDIFELTVGSDTLRSPDVDGNMVAFLGNATMYYAYLTPTEVMPFPDVPARNPYFNAISEMTMNRIIEGYEDGRFGPGNLITRQQFAKMIVLTMALRIPTVFTPTLSDTYRFSDFDASAGEKEALYPYRYVARAALTGLIRGYPDGTFRPLTNISRQQVITMIVRAGRQVVKEPPASWTGGVLGYTNPAHGRSILIAEYNGLLKGIVGPRGTLGGWDTTEDATRGEVAQMLYNLLGKLSEAE